MSRRHDPRSLIGRTLSRCRDWSQRMPLGAGWKWGLGVGVGIGLGLLPATPTETVCHAQPPAPNAAPVTAPAPPPLMYPPPPTALPVHIPSMRHVFAPNASPVAPTQPVTSVDPARNAGVIAPVATPGAEESAGVPRARLFSGMRLPIPRTRRITSENPAPATATAASAKDNTPLMLPKSRGIYENTAVLQPPTPRDAPLANGLPRLMPQTSTASAKPDAPRGLDQSVNTTSDANDAPASGPNPRMSGIEKPPRPTPVAYPGNGSAASVDLASHIMATVPLPAAAVTQGAVANTNPVVTPTGQTPNVVLWPSYHGMTPAPNVLPVTAADCPTCVDPGCYGETCHGNPALFPVAPVGTSVNAVFDVMRIKGDQQQWMFYDSDFQSGTDGLSQSGYLKLLRLTRDPRNWSGNLAMEWVPTNPLLTSARKEALAAKLREAGIALTGDQIVAGPAAGLGLSGTEAVRNVQGMNQRYVDALMKNSLPPNIQGPTKP